MTKFSFSEKSNLFQSQRTSIKMISDPNADEIELQEKKCRKPTEVKETDKKITYHFPLNALDFKIIKSPQEWKQKYDSIKQLPAGTIEAPRYRVVGPKIIPKGGKRLYIYCRYHGCRSVFAYIWKPTSTTSDQGYFFLQSHKFKHDHSSEQEQKRNKIKSKTQKILSDYIRDALSKNPTIQFKDIKRHFSSKLNIDEARLRYHFDLAKIFVKDMNKKNQLFEGIQKNKLIFMCDKYEEWKDEKFRFLVTCTEMVKSYEKWFKVMYVTVNLAERFEESEEDIYLGSFSGVNGNMESVPFAIFLVKLNMRSLSLLIKDFFSKMLNLGKFQQQPGTSQKDWLPSTMITTYLPFSDQLHKILLTKEFCLQPNLSTSIQSSFRNTTFLHEALSFLSNFKSQKISSYLACCSEQKFVKLILQPQKIRFGEWIERDLERVGYNFGVQDGEILPYEEFLEQAEKVCLSQFREGTFIGSYLINDSRKKVCAPESLRLISHFMCNYLKSRQSGFVDKFYSFFTQMRQRSRRLHTITEANHQSDNYEDILKLPEIAKISFVVQKKVFRLIIEKVMGTICLKTFKSNANLVLVYNNANSELLLKEYANEKNSINLWQSSEEINSSQEKEISVFKNVRQYYYQVHYDTTLNRWMCQCGYYILRGLPCEHQLAVCIRYNYSIEKQVSNYWMRKDQRILFWNQPKKRGRPRVYDP